MTKIFGLFGYDPSKQKGVGTLAIGIIILFLATLLTFFAVKVQVQEQRISSNDYRAKTAFEAAQGGIDRAQMYLNENSGQLEDISWTACSDALPGWQVDASECPDNFIWATVPDVPFDNPEQAYRAFLLTADDDGDGNPADVDEILVTIISEGASDIPGAGGVANFDTGNSYSVVKVIVDTVDILVGPVDVPVIALGNVIGTGNWHVSTGSNAGGTGVPVSVWTGGNFDENGSMSTCQPYEFYLSGAAAYYRAGSSYTFGEESDDLVYCTDCICEAGDALSKKGLQGADIVDNDPNFPDLFDYLFGRPRENWEIIYNYAKKITDCRALSASSKGLIWYEGAGRCKINENNENSIIGSPEHPVLLVIDEGLRINTGSTFFGVIYVFSHPDKNLVRTIEMNGNNNYYGAILTDFAIDTANGTQRVVYSDLILKNLWDDLTIFGKVLGTWKDYM